MKPAAKAPGGGCGCLVLILIAVGLAIWWGNRPPSPRPVRPVPSARAPAPVSDLAKREAKFQRDLPSLVELVTQLCQDIRGDTAHSRLTYIKEQLVSITDSALLNHPDVKKLQQEVGACEAKLYALGRGPSTASTEPVPPKETTAAAEARRLAEKWSYSSREDPMSSRKVTHASIESENSVSFGFPYSGPQQGTLTIRNHPTQGVDVIFSIARGQILCQSYTDCTIRVRFNESNAERWSAVGPVDNSSTVIFLRSEQRFIQRLRGAKVLRLQIPFYQEGAPIFEFEVGGFDNARYKRGN